MEEKNKNKKCPSFLALGPFALNSTWMTKTCRRRERETERRERRERKGKKRIKGKNGRMRERE